MELQFEKKAWPCLITAAAQVKNEEQTQEVRLGDNMPDIGKVLGAWGQILLRGKEWRGAGMSVSAGVMVWVLYAPEDGTEPQLVETWLPVQLKWEFPQTQHDGIILANCLLSSVDARSVSARKLMVRTVVSVFGEAVVSENVEVCNPEKVPEDVHLLRRTYPVRLPREAGEKSFSLEEDVVLPSMVSKVIYGCLQPEIVDTNVVAGKAVFRGVGKLHVLLQDEEGKCSVHEEEFHFSQFADLDKDYEEEAQLRVVPAVTNFDLELTAPDHLRVKAGLVGQFVVSDRKMLEVVEDAYSNRRPVTVRQDMLHLPSELEREQQTLRLTADVPPEVENVIDVRMLCGHPRIMRDEQGVLLELSGTYQILSGVGTERKGMLVHSEGELHLSASEDATVRSSVVSVSKAQVSNELRTEVMMTTVATPDEGIPMVTGLTLGEVTQPDPNRPSMILRRSGGKGLWELAKATGSTVDEITRINQLQGEPGEERLLLIPVV